MKTYSVAVVAFLGSVFLWAQAPLDLATQTRDCITAIQLKDTPPNRQKKAQCQTLANSLVQALLPPSPPVVLPPNPPTPPPDPVTTRGPQATITCPAGAVSITPGQNIQAAVTANPAGASFCLKAGVHSITSAITPKSGNTFTGEFGAILDGTAWPKPLAMQGTTTLPKEQWHFGAFMAHNQDIDDVTFRNLTIRKMPRYAIKAWGQTFADRWIIEHTDILDNVFGVGLPNASVIRHSHILRNLGVPGPEHALNGGGFAIFRSDGVLFENVEIAYNAPETKVAHSSNVTFRRVWVHHGQHNGLWYDGDSPGSVVEDSIIEDNPILGLFLEVAQRVTVRRNILRRNGWAGISLATTRDTQIYENTIENIANGSVGFSLRAECSRTGGGELPVKWDLTGNTIRDNKLVIPAGGSAVTLAFDAGCDATYQAPYRSNTKANLFTRNTYDVTNLTGGYWLWPTGTSALTFTQWKAAGQDATGTVQ